MPTSYPTTVKDLQDCYSLGAFQRFTKCIEESSKSNSLRVRGVKITNPECKNPVCCCVPLRDASKGVVIVDKKGYPKKNDHQDRIPTEILEDFEKKMAGYSKTFTTFEELFDDVVTHSGVRPCLMIYDFCLRYGHYIHLKPKDKVYLFKGAKAGAESYFGCSIKPYRISTSSFRPDFPAKFESHYIEDFLCVCCDHIAYIRKNHPTTLPTSSAIIP